MITKKLCALLIAFTLCVSTMSTLIGRQEKPNPEQPKTFTLSQTELSLFVGESEELVVTTDVSGTVEWASSNSAVASVSQGVVTALSVGETIVTASIGSDYKAQCKVTVEGQFSAIVEGEVGFSYFEDLQPLKELDVISYDFGTNKHSQQGTAIFGELISLSVLQGLLARTEGNTLGLYLNVKQGGLNAASSKTWLEELGNLEGVTVTEIEETADRKPFEIALEKYSNFVTKTANNKPGYVLFEQKIVDAVDADGNQIQKGEQEVNAACTVSAATGYLAIDVTSKELAESLGYEMAVDARGWSEQDAFNRYSDNLSSDVIMLTNNGQAENRDLGIALGTYFMYESNIDNAFMNKITDPVNGKYQQGTLTVGWSATGEVNQVNRHALYGFNFTCTNYSWNLSQLARQGDKCFKQKSNPAKITADPTKKYVTFIMTDGDNITWHQGDFPFSETWYGYSGRGSFPMGWTMAPIMADIAPSIIKHEYEMATEKDEFVCGVSGAGYVYPSEYVKAMQYDALDKFVDATGEYMRRADLDYVEILDNQPFNSTVMDVYSSNENIHGGFVLANYDYYKQGGDIKWYNGKPFIGIGEAMWSDTPGRVAHRLNSLPVDITSANGYTVVKVHCWTTAMEDLQRVVNLLDSNIEIVTPSQMIQLVSDNVKTDSKRTAVPDTDYPEDVDEYVDANYFWNNLPLNSKTEFTFDKYLDYEGWEKHIGSKQYDYVSFSGEPWVYSTATRTTVDGGSGYSIRLDGSDYGNLDSNPNSAIYSKLKVPNSDNARFSFFVRGEAYGYDADYRVRIITNKNGAPELLSLNKAWTAAGDDKWIEVCYDVSEYKDQEVIFIIEHNSTSKEGDGEILYIDNITIGEETLDLATIKKATVNAKTSFDFADGAQGFASATANGASAEYDANMQALVANVKATNLANGGADVAYYTRFDLSKVSGFTHHKFGVFMQAESGKTAQVRLSMVSADGKSILRNGPWTTISDKQTYMSYDLDSIRIQGGAFKYAYAIIEVRGAGSDAKVYIDNASFAKITRDIEGLYYDAEYLKNLSAVEIASLSNLSAWGLEGGRGLEDVAQLQENSVRLYGYDFMRGNDTMLVSKALSGYAKVKNEYNARMFAKVNVGSASSISFDVARIEKTLTNQNAVIPQVRVIFIKDDGGVVVLNDWKDISSYKTTTVQVSLSAVANMTGTIVIEMDCSQNGDRAGVNLSNIVIG
ncbi:MAG: Ig-like domain-containing protein [Clostridia bacterium]|nr:Ig-like domain-containing protein [Clostridia bacterium]